MQTTVKQGQSAIDIAMQTGGSAEAVFSFAKANGIGITDELTNGASYAGADVLDRRMLKYYSDNKITPATAWRREGEGIGYWEIEFDFIVS